MLNGEIFSEASKAAKAAFEATPEDMFCGFAWVKITPARGPFVKWLKENNIGDKGWNGGWELWSSDLATGISASQSMLRKEAAARAFAEVLRDHGIEAWMGSRAD